MRRRRRYSTQATGKIKNQNPETGMNRIQPQKDHSKFWKYLFLLIFVIAAGYSVYTYIFPRFMQIKKEMEQPELIQADRPALPVQEQKEPEITPIQRKIQVEVLNGCGEPGIAKILTDKLRDKGYDVVNSGNYIDRNGKINWKVEHTHIIDQLKNTENLIKAKELADVMDIDVNRIESFENTSPIADLTIVIGKDFTQLSIFKKD